MKKTIVSLALLIVSLVVIFSVKVNVSAPNSTRVIVDHTNKIYVSPPCFDQADVTNYLDETTLDQALKMNYEQEGTCTEQSLVEKVTLANYFFQLIGVKDSKWGKDGQW